MSISISKQNKLAKKFENCKDSKLMVLEETETQLSPEIWNIIASYIGKTPIANIISPEVIDSFTRYNRAKELGIIIRDAYLEESKLYNGTRMMNCLCHNRSKINGYVHKEILSSYLETHLKSKRHKKFVIQKLQKKFPNILIQTIGPHI